MDTEKTCDKATAEPNEQNEKLKTGFEWVSTMIFALIIVAIVFALLFRVVSVSGDSMQPTLLNGERLLLTSLFYTPERGDVVVLYRPDDEPLIKRVIAVGGDRVRIDENTGGVVVNDKELEEPYIGDGATPPFSLEDEITVPEGHLFVLGDNRWNSLDSRALGTFPLRQVMGEVLIRLSPPYGKI